MFSLLSYGYQHMRSYGLCWCNLNVLGLAGECWWAIPSSSSRADKILQWGLLCSAVYISWKWKRWESILCLDWSQECNGKHGVSSMPRCFFFNWSFSVMTGITYITLQSFIYTEMKIKRRAPVSLANISYLICKLYFLLGL